jgi:hypothetical protein
MATSLGAIIGPLFASETPPGQDKKRAEKPKTKVSKKTGTMVTKTTKAEKSVTEPDQQHGELASADVPTPIERTHDHARDAKVRATQDWVEGRMTSKQHENIHARANHVLMSKSPRQFKGTTGEKAPPKKAMKGMW